MYFWFSSSIGLTVDINRKQEKPNISTFLCTLLFTVSYPK